MVVARCDVLRTAISELRVKTRTLFSTARAHSGGAHVGLSPTSSLVVSNFILQWSVMLIGTVHRWVFARIADVASLLQVCLLAVAACGVTSSASADIFKVGAGGLHEKASIDLREFAGGPYSWSPDSKHIAVGGWSSGNIAVIDVTTGAVQKAASGLPAVRAVTWSSDGSRLAASWSGGLSILTWSSSVPVVEATFSSPGIRPGLSLSFTGDGKSLLFDQVGPRASERTLIYRINLADAKFETAVQTPYAGRMAVDRDDSSNQFLKDRNVAFVTTFIRYDDGIPTPGSTNPLDRTAPATCFVVSFDDAGQPAASHTFDFPPKGSTDPSDGSADISKCRYAPQANQLVVSKKVPLFRRKGSELLSEVVDGLFETISLPKLTATSRFGPIPRKLGGLDETQFAISPDASVAATTVNGSSYHAIVSWNPTSGVPESELQVDGYLSAPSFSSDGSFVSFESSTGLLIYSLHQK